MLRDRVRYNEYMRKYMLDRYYERRQLAFDYLGEFCNWCGASENLEFDHIDRDTKSSPSANFGRFRYVVSLLKLKSVKFFVVSVTKKKQGNTETIVKVIDKFA